MATQAYCVKCKTKRDMNNEEEVTMKNGRNALSGKCNVCGTKMFKIGGGSGVRQTVTKAKAASKKPTKKAVRRNPKITKGKK